MATNRVTPTRLLTRRASWRTLATVVAGLTLVGGINAAGAAPNAPQPPELPPVTISSITLRAGETISISGTGCVDPDTQTGAGLEVVLYVPLDMGRGGLGVQPTVRAKAEADGTFKGSSVVEQPLFPDGAQTGFFICQAEGADPYASAVAQRPVQLTIEAPSLPDLTLAAGTTVDYELPCSIPDGGYGLFSIQAKVDGGESFYLTAPGNAPPEKSPQKGQQVKLQVPPEARPGVYDATASCSVSEAGTSAFFSGFTVTITGGGTTASTPGPIAPTPAPAAPIPGTPNFTG